MRMSGDSAQVDGMNVGSLSKLRATKAFTQAGRETCPCAFLHCSLPYNAIPEAEMTAGFIDETTQKLAASSGLLPGVWFAPLWGPMIRRSVDLLRQDLRFAWRGFMRTPGFLAIGVATLGLGIGANSAIFTLVNAVVLRPLPYEDPER